MNPSVEPMSRYRRIQIAASPAFAKTEKGVFWGPASNIMPDSALRLIEATNPSPSMTHATHRKRSTWVRIILSDARRSSSPGGFAVLSTKQRNAAPSGWARMTSSKAFRWRSNGIPVTSPRQTTTQVCPTSAAARVASWWMIRVETGARRGPPCMERQKSKAHPNNGSPTFHQRSGRAALAPPRQRRDLVRDPADAGTPRCSARQS